MHCFDSSDYFNGYGMNGYEYFGAHLTNQGVIFRLDAPNARQVYLVGDFNGWQSGQTALSRNEQGVWEITIPGLQEYARYKYLIEDVQGHWREKSDPYGFYGELRPSWSNKVVSLEYPWKDEAWMQSRSRCYDAPMNIYEVHLGGFKHDENDCWLTYYQMIDQLIPYVQEMGYTHIELMPLNEHALDASWGYQQTGYFSVTSRYGSPYQLMMLIEACHLNGIGVIMDFVPAHFVKDDFGLIRFDGTPLYESEYPDVAESQWGTLYFDYSKERVRSFMMSSACLWLDKYHIDGLRMDAVSNLIYFQGNKQRGENTPALDFIRRFNYHVHEHFPSAITIAEDSTDFPYVTAEVPKGLGFDYKWDLGWMNDTLKYYAMDPEYRRYHHNQINFSMAYFYNERFLMPLSHDEVVHSKGTIIDKMWGSYEDKFAQCRNLMVYMMAHPGKKLSFMGNEIASFREFDENKALDWFLLQYPMHDAFKRLCRDLNHVYKAKPAFWQDDYRYEGFHWIDADNADQRIYSFIRYDQEHHYVVVLNMSPVSYESFDIGVPGYGYYCEIINSQKDIYGGCNMCNFKKIRGRKGKKHGMPYTLTIRIAPYGAIIFEGKNR